MRWSSSGFHQTEKNKDTGLQLLRLDGATSAAPFPCIWLLRYWLSGSSDPYLCSLQFNHCIYRWPHLGHGILLLWTSNRYPQPKHKYFAVCFLRLNTRHTLIKNLLCTTSNPNLFASTSLFSLRNFLFLLKQYYLDCQKGEQFNLYYSYFWLYINQQLISLDMIISPRIQGGGLLFIPQGATPCTPPSLSSYKLSLLGVK